MAPRKPTKFEATMTIAMDDLAKKFDRFETDDLGVGQAVWTGSVANVCGGDLQQASLAVRAPHIETPPT